MIVEIRKTAHGTEYWDNEKKKTIFVPTGQTPIFAVTKNPKSMLDKEPTLPVSDEVVLKPVEDMDLKELKAYAAEKNIKIPSDIKKRDDIANYILNNWTPDEE